MTIGWIGAGKVGFSLGKYLSGHGYKITGYYSRNPESACQAAEFTGTGHYENMEDLVRDSEVIFLTVPDDVIVQIWEQLKSMQIGGKTICHCSGVLSSEIFSDKQAYGVCSYSIHPLLAVNDRLHSYKELSKALFTIEGDEGRKQEMADLFRHCGNQVIFLNPQDKVRYHAAAVMASNLVLGLAETAMEVLEGCGFDKASARAALTPFMQRNAGHLAEQEIEECLTGPVERNDVSTLEKHMDALSGADLDIYRELSKKVLNIAKRKNPGRDYKRMEELLQ